MLELFKRGGLDIDKPSTWRCMSMANGVNEISLFLISPLFLNSGVSMFKQHKQPSLRGFSLHAFQTRMNAVWFDGKMSETQRDCLAGFGAAYLIYNRILGKKIPVSWLAYVLATAYHETAFTMRPIEEYGKGSGRTYGAPDPATGQTYYGRGFVQLTWLENYQRAQASVVNFTNMKNDIDLVSNPELALVPWIAAQIAIAGMSEGWFTGKSLGDYLTDTTTDYVNARRIINGTDKAQTIAAYATEIESAIRLAQGEGIERSLVQMGSKGDDVRELQLMLGLDADGAAGKDTVNAIMNFQSANKLTVDGKCGNDTWKALDKEAYILN